jgi:hypothetical protein
MTAAAGGMSRATENLYAAVMSRDVTAVAVALDAGADPNGPPEWCYDPFGLVVKLPKEAGVRVLVMCNAFAAGKWRHTPSPLSFVWPERVSALWPACVAITDLLLAAGANVHTTDVHGIPPLAWVADNGCTAGVRQLLAAGARCHTDADGRAADRCALLAALNCSSDAADPVGCVEALLVADGDVAFHLQGPGGISTLWLVAQRCSPAAFPALARLLVDAGAEVKPPRGSPMRSPLVAAATRVHIRPTGRPQIPLSLADTFGMVRALLALGAPATPAVWAAGPMAALPHAMRAELVGEAAWARRGRLVALRRQMRLPDERVRAAANEAAGKGQGCSIVAGVPAGGTAGHASGMAWTDGPATAGAAFGAGSIP